MDKANKYSFEQCKQCRQYKALKNDYCKDCEGISTSQDIIKHIFGDIFSKGN